MGKRKHKDKKSHGKNKRRRDKRRRYYESDTSSSSQEEGHEVDRYRHNYPESSHYEPNYTPDCEYDFPLSDSDISITAHTIKSVVEIHNEPNQTTRENSCDIIATEVSRVVPSYRTTIGPNPTIGPNLTMDSGATTDPTATTPLNNPDPGTSAETSTLPIEILEALGDPKGREELFGPKIPEEIAKRWGRILVDGLTKEQKQEIIEKSLIPDNFRLAKAPLLNPEIIPVLSEPARNRDKLLEKSQNQLGLGISKLTNLAADVISGNVDKIEILKKISETSQIFLDLHHEDTKRRRKLVTSSLDKRFLSIINEVKRDTYLFGDNLGEKIKTSKTAERSGLQIKRTDHNTIQNFRKNSQQGNWKGPPRAPAHRAYRQGGQKSRYPQQQNRRPPPPTERQPRMTGKQTSKPAKT